MYIYITHFWLDLGRKRRGAFAREDGVVRDFFFQSSYIYKDISLQFDRENITKSSHHHQKKKKKKRGPGSSGWASWAKPRVKRGEQKLSVSCYNRKDEFLDRLFEALEIAKNDYRLYWRRRKRRRHQKRAKLRLKAHTDLEEFVKSLKKPRRILLIPAGKPVEMTLEALKPLVESDDVIIDGGNEHFSETRRRERCAPSIGQTRRPKERTLKGFISSAWAFPAARKARDTDRRSCLEALNSRITV